MQVQLHFFLSILILFVFVKTFDFKTVFNLHPRLKTFRMINRVVINYYYRCCHITYKKLTFIWQTYIIYLPNLTFQRNLDALLFLKLLYLALAPLFQVTCFKSRFVYVRLEIDAQVSSVPGRS